MDGCCITPLCRLTSTYAYVNPIVAVFLGWLLAGEELNARIADRLGNHYRVGRADQQCATG